MTDHQQRLEETNRQQRREDLLESLIDKVGLETVIQSLANVCYNKGDHIETTWQDEALATGWFRMAGKLEKTLSDSLSRLEAERDQLRAALRSCAHQATAGLGAIDEGLSARGDLLYCEKIARAALGEDTQP